jgi:hypothetical protein
VIPANFLDYMVDQVSHKNDILYIIQKTLYALLNSVNDDKIRQFDKIMEDNEILENSKTSEKCKMIVLRNESIIPIKKLGNISHKIKSQNVSISVSNIVVNQYIFCKLNNKLLSFQICEEATDKLKLNLEAHIKDRLS